MYATQASVVIVKPAGTRSAPRMRVISATFAPLPPRRSRMSREPSAKSYTHFVPTAVAMARPILSVRRSPQTDAGGVLHGLPDPALGLPQGAPGAFRRLCERPRQGLGEEVVGL